MSRKRNRKNLPERPRPHVGSEANPAEALTPVPDGARRGLGSEVRAMLDEARDTEPANWLAPVSVAVIVTAIIASKNPLIVGQIVGVFLIGAVLVTAVMAALHVGWIACRRLTRKRGGGDA